MISLVSKGFDQSDKKVKITESASFATYFTGLQGFIRGFLEGVCITFTGTSLIICDREDCL